MTLSGDIDFDQASLMVEDEWDKFCSTNDFFQRTNQQFNKNTRNIEIDRKIELIKNSINQHVHLRDECNKLYDEMISKIIDKSDLDLEDIPNLDQLIETHQQTKEEYHRMKEEFVEISFKRNQYLEEFKTCDSEIEVLRKQRDCLQQQIDDAKNDIKLQSSKICIRTHKNSLVAMVFNNDGHLDNFLTEDKENSSKEDFWKYLNEKNLR